MESELEETNATPDNGGASTLDPLDRIERYLSGAEEGPSAPEEGKTAQNEVEPDGGGEQQADEPQITTSDLAKLLKLDDGSLDLDEEGHPVFKTKVDGKEGTAKLADLLKSYQLEGYVNKRSMELAEREKAMQAKAQEAEQQFSQRLQYAENLANVASQQLLQEFQSIDWKSLEQQDPGTAALWRQKFQERQLQLRGVYQNVEQEKAQHTQKSEQRERARLPELIPEWKDPAVAERERVEILGWLGKSGFEPGDLDMNKAATIALVRKVMFADKLAASKPEIENKVRTAPKLVKPGQAPQNTQEQSLRNLKTAVQKSGGKSNAVEAFLIATGRV